MSSSKAALKAINDAIRQQKFDDAIEKSKEFLSKDKNNYQAQIFLAFSLDKKNKTHEAEDVYRTATQSRPQDAQAWQGLTKLYEKQGAKKLAEYQQAVISLAQIFRDADDMFKCQDAVDKYIDYVRLHGDKLQYADALWLRLPESPVYSILEGRFPQPAKTYEVVAGILEEFERKRVNTLIGERRTRLGAKLSEVTLEVKREVYAQSRLEHIYRQLINWTSDDELRRTYEEKLLQYCYDRLMATPPGELKVHEKDKVFGLANDMVVIKHPYRLAWEIAIDWQDKKTIGEYDVNVLRAYCGFFPETDLYKIITSFLTSMVSPFPQLEMSADAAQPNGQSDDSDDDEGGVPTSVVPFTEEDRLIMITEGITTTDSVFAYRLAGQYFIHVGEYESTVEFMRKAMDFVAKERTKTGIDLVNTEDDYRLSLGTALVYYQSPRHHQEAKNLFDKVLEHDPSSTSALIGVGLIFEEEEELDQAIDFLRRALKRDGTNIRVRSEAAWITALKGDWEIARADLKACTEIIEKQKDHDKGLLADLQYRLGSCLWNLDTSRQARKQRRGECAYSYWINALKNDMNHAPTYTSLGIFYSDYAKDKQRSRRCFQKALELSASEVVAAERLARSFADDGDWDRVELVAQRIVDSGKVKPPPGSKRKGISWPFAALGVAELNKQGYHKAIVSFQAALRISPEDYHSWAGLGESYHSSGRFMAATKAIVNAQRIEDESEKDMSADSWFTKYMLANIKRELGEYDESITHYQEVMKTRPEEEGVMLAFMQTMVENALSSIDKGLFGKSIQLAIDAFDFAATVTGHALETFNFWKTLAEACSVFCSVQSHTSAFPTKVVATLLEKAPQEAFDIMSVDKVGTDVVYAKGIYAADEQPGVEITRCLHASILCHKLAIHLTASDVHAQPVAYYNLGWAEHRAHASLPSHLRKGSTSYIKAAVRCFKRAIELEAGNSDFWNALGVVTSEIHPSVSQHAFVRSLHLNERSPVAWTNLGTLALFSGDVRTANEIFTRAQSTDPDYAHAWLGQGFVALLHGNVKEARGLFTHAMEIADASSLPTRRHYSSSMFDYVLTSPLSLDIASLIQPLFALNQVQSMRPNDLAFGHLASLYMERTRDSTRAVELLEKICSATEADYEVTESPDSLARFTLAKTDLARAYLAAGSYSEAAECGDMALGLSSDESDSELTRDQRRKARLSAHLTLGLAQYYQDNFDEAEKCFEAALEESDNNPDATCLLAQVLWAQGSDEAKDKARASLFEVIEKHPNHVQSVLLLGVIALLDNDTDSIEAVTEELHSLRAKHVTPREQSHISTVLQAIATEKSEEDLLTQIQTDIMLYPDLPHGWGALAEAEGSEFAAKMALEVARRGVPPRGDLEAGDLARAFAGTGMVGDAQRSALLAPWESVGWEALAVTTKGI